MKNIKANFKKILLISFSFIIVLLASISVISFITKEANNPINEFKEELINNEGQYDNKQIVLENTNEVEAKKLAKRLNAKLRITKDGSFATLTLPNDIVLLSPQISLITSVPTT